MADLNGKTIAFLVAAEGIERVELTEPWAAVVEAGGTPVLLSPRRGRCRRSTTSTRPRRFAVDKAVKDADVADYDALVLPGGVANPDQLRTDGDAVGFVRDFVGTGKPVAAICHAPWTLVEAGVLQGRTLTSWPSLRTDITNAGGDLGRPAGRHATATSSPAATPMTSRRSPRRCSTPSGADRPLVARSGDDLHPWLPFRLLNVFTMATTRSRATRCVSSRTRAV